MAKKSQSKLVPSSSVRSICFPVKWPCDEEDKDSLRKVVTDCFKAATTISQETIRQILIQDSYVRQPGDVKLPKSPKVYTYQKGDERYATWASTVAAIKHDIESRWRKLRYDVLWTNKMGIPSYRYPQPFPFGSKNWHIVDSQDRLRINLKLMGFKEEIPVECKLGPGQHRNLSAARKMHNGEYKRGTATLYENRSGELMLKLACYIPDKQERTTGGALRVFSCADSFLVAENDTANKLWVLNAIHVRQWIVKHDIAMKRFREDLKADRRLRTGKRKGLMTQSQAAQRKMRNRLDSFVHESSCQLVEYAYKRGFAEIALDLSDKSYFDHFPWYQLETQIASKAKHKGLRVSEWERKSRGRSQDVSEGE